jgi:hypothetical protein
MMRVQFVAIMYCTAGLPLTDFDVVMDADRFRLTQAGSHATSTPNSLTNLEVDHYS